MTVLDAIRITPTWHDAAVFVQGAVVGELVAAFVRFGRDVTVCFDHPCGPAVIRKAVWDDRGTDHECVVLTDWQDAEDD